MAASVDPVPPPPRAASRRNVVALNATNFFVAEVMGVVLPFLSDFLREQGWRYDTIGIATAVAGLGVFLMQTPAGMAIDRLGRHRMLLAGSSLLLGVLYGLVPLVPSTAACIMPLLFAAGIMQAFLAPLLAALALSLGGPAGLNRVMGANQAWNHVGNIACALLAVALVSSCGIPLVFYSTTAVSILATMSVLCLQSRQDSPLARRRPRQGASLKPLLRNRQVMTLVICTAVFHLANIPVMPMVALYMRKLNGSHAQVAALILVSQVVMVPAAYCAGRLGDRWGRKPVMAIAFATLPVRVLLCAYCTTPAGLLLIQGLDGLVMGIYGVVIASMCGDLVGESGQFNTLMGMATTALALGGVLGPFISGVLMQQLGFCTTFYVLAAAAAAALVLFISKMPETRRA